MPTPPRPRQTRSKIRTTPTPATRRPKASKAQQTHTAGKWPPETKQRALDLYQNQGLAHAAGETHIPKSTIRGWARAAGIEIASVAARSAEQTRAATEASLQRRQVAIAEAREQLVEQLAQTALESLALERAMIAGHLEAIRAAAQEDGAVSARTNAVLTAVTSGNRLSNVVGSRTRAIHDLQLLDGQATEQPAGGLTIVFATTSPAEQPAHPPRIIDLEPLELP